jgi:hydrogenase maturation protease
MLAPVLIFAVGNESRGDDALAPLLLRELDAWLAANGRAEQVELLEDFQLQVEHAMDMQGRRLVLFIDAGMDTPAPFSFARLQANATPVLYSHALEPAALMNVYRQFYGESPPDAFVLCICGERFELGEGLSSSAKERLSAAFEFCKKLLQGADVAEWNNYGSSTIVASEMYHEATHQVEVSC